MTFSLINKHSLPVECKHEVFQNLVHLTTFQIVVAFQPFEIFFLNLMWNDSVKQSSRWCAKSVLFDENRRLSHLSETLHWRYARFHSLCFLCLLALADWALIKFARLTLLEQMKVLKWHDQRGSKLWRWWSFPQLFFNLYLHRISINTIILSSFDSASRCSCNMTSLKVNYTYEEAILIHSTMFSFIESASIP